MTEQNGQFSEGSKDIIQGVGETNPQQKEQPKKSDQELVNRLTQLCGQEKEVFESEQIKEALTVYPLLLNPGARVSSYFREIESSVGTDFDDKRLYYPGHIWMDFNIWVQGIGNKQFQFEEYEQLVLVPGIGRNIQGAIAGDIYTGEQRPRLFEAITNYFEWVQQKQAGKLSESQQAQLIEIVNTGKELMERGAHGRAPERVQEKVETRTEGNPENPYVQRLVAIRTGLLDDEKGLESDKVFTLNNFDREKDAGKQKQILIGIMKGKGLDGIKEVLGKNIPITSEDPNEVTLAALLKYIDSAKGQDLDAAGMKAWVNKARSRILVSIILQTARQNENFNAYEASEQKQIEQRLYNRFLNPQEQVPGMFDESGKLQIEALNQQVFSILDQVDPNNSDSSKYDMPFEEPTDEPLRAIKEKTPKPKPASLYVEP